MARGMLGVGNRTNNVVSAKSNLCIQGDNQLTPILFILYNCKMWLHQIKDPKSCDKNRSQILQFSVWEGGAGLLKITRWEAGNGCPLLPMAFVSTVARCAWSGRACGPGWLDQTIATDWTIPFRAQNKPNRVEFWPDSNSNFANFFIN
jgi:hypothetical protein